MIEEKNALGLVQVYTGDGKGKTTASLGLGLRAAGHGYKVTMIQFMKGQINYGELESVKNIQGFEIHQFGRPDFVDKENPDPIDIKLAREGLDFAKKAVGARECDILILDEANVAVDFNLFTIEELLAVIKDRPPGMEIIVTGRNAHDKLLAIADLVSSVTEVKHPFRKGVMAREGVEF